jgi:hypothetical protein
MKLEELSRKNAKSFVYFWTAAYCFFSLMVIWTMAAELSFHRLNPNIPAYLMWSQIFLMLIILLSLFFGIVQMWSKYLRGEFEKIRGARNLSFFAVLFFFPVAMIIQMVIASFQA